MTQPEDALRSSSTSNPKPPSFGGRIVRAILGRVPRLSRPALFYETFYNFGSGAFLSLFLLSLAALKSDTIFSPAGTKEHLMLVAAMFGGSSMLSPLVTYAGRKIPMKLLVVFPNLLVAALLLNTILWRNATVFAVTVGLAFLIRVFPRVAEMNMYRVLYPNTHRGRAVGWLRGVAAVAGLVTAVLGTLWFSRMPQYYWAVYCAVAVAMVASTTAYWMIPVSNRTILRPTQKSVAPHRAFWQGIRILCSDTRFVRYQLGFWLAGFANHMSHAYIAESLKTDAQASSTAIFWIVAILPATFMAASSPVWGRFLDRVNPMTGRALFNSLQFVAYGCHFYGGWTAQVWPFVVGSIIHAIGNGGGTINWLTGSLYFAKPEQVPLYTSVHVGLTGVRGMIAPIVGVALYGSSLTIFGVVLPGLGLGPFIFFISALLSLSGSCFMIYLSRHDEGPAELVQPADEKKLKRPNKEVVVEQAS